MARPRSPKRAETTQSEFANWKLFISLKNENYYCKQLSNFSWLQVELAKLKQDEGRVRALANIARPAGTPELTHPWPSESSSAPSRPARQAPIIGKKRLPFKKPLPQKKVRIVEGM